MLIKEIREIAARYGIKPGKMTKGDLVRAIQRSEGNFDCFESASTSGECDQMLCVWRNDCLGNKEAAAPKKAPAKKKSSAKKAAPKKAVKKKAAKKR